MGLQCLLNCVRYRAVVFVERATRRRAKFSLFEAECDRLKANEGFVAVAAII
jgi:hypothetical protein